MSSTLEKIKQKQKSKKITFILSLSSYSVKYMSLKERVLKKKKNKSNDIHWHKTNVFYSLLKFIYTMTDFQTTLIYIYISV